MKEESAAKSSGDFKDAKKVDKDPKEETAPSSFFSHAKKNSDGKKIEDVPTDGKKNGESAAASFFAHAKKNSDAKKIENINGDEKKNDSAASSFFSAKKNNDAKNDANGDAKKKETDKPKDEDTKEDVVVTPLAAKPYQNWSDLFFLLDSLSYSQDSCDLLLFLTKICPLAGIDHKKVSTEHSFLDTATNTLIVAHTDAGLMESLLGQY